ncbi:MULTISPECIES: aldo/keto reductase [unclassified Caballeronia]|uniref:aldo/keto reductase n=1 Tax=unclassified Caballeronia TaxID=2646786 RepID=UPI0020295FA2|nr:MULTISPECIES: aldo/keto reductase [unclassified Caballeronia]
MDYITLGTTGLRISRLSLGAMTFGAGSGIWGNIAGLDRDQAIHLTAVAAEQGVNLIDTADVYSQGLSEEIVGQVIKALSFDETKMLVATKVRLRTGPSHNQVGLGRSHIIRSVETSLRRLGRDHIDLLQLHDRDALVPLDETLRSLDDLVTQGKVRHIGACNFSAADMERASAYTERTDRTPIVSNQVHYALTSRDVEHDIVTVAESRSMGLLVWSPLAGGYLSGKYASAESSAGRRSKLEFPPVDQGIGHRILEVLIEVADSLEASQAQVAIAWLLAKRAVASVIVGARTPEQLAQNLDARNIQLSVEHLARLDSVSETRIPYPHWMQRYHDKDRLI